MWDETLIETRGVQTERKRWLFGFPFAAVLHGGVIVTLAIASYWNIEAMTLPVQGRVSAFMVESLPAGPPPALGVQHIRREEVKEPKKASAPENIAQPVITQEIIPEQATNSDTENVVESSSEQSIGSFGWEHGVEGGGEVPVGGGNGFGEGDDIINEPPKEYESFMEEPVLLHRVNPEYPEVVRRARIQGVVVLRAVINREGVVEDVKVQRSDHPMLDQSATRAVLQWRYRPAYFNGKPLRVYFTVTVKYTLR